MYLWIIIITLRSFAKYWKELQYFEITCCRAQIFIFVLLLFYKKNKCNKKNP